MGSLALSSHYSQELPFANVFKLILSRPLSATTLKKARQLHALILTSTPPTSSPFLFNNLLSLYSKCASFLDARNLFDSMPHRNLISYNTLISSLSKFPHRASSSFKIFSRLALSDVKPSASTFASLALASASLHNQSLGSAVHCKVRASGFLSNVCIQTSLLVMYSDCGAIDSADKVFTEMTERDSVAWNCIISCSLKSGGFEKGMQLYHRMMKDGILPNQCTLSIALNACGKVRDLVRGRIVHGHVITSDVAVDNPLENALLDMYASCGNLATAVSVFKRIEMPDLVSWNSLIAGFSDAGEGEQAMGAFIQLKALSLRPDEYTFAAVVSATSVLPFLCYGKPLHAQVCKTGFQESVYVSNTLMNMYFMNNDLRGARRLFDCVPEKDVVVWTEMIIGHARLSESELAIKYFNSMLKEGHKVDSFSLSGALSASAELVTLRQGEMLHSLVVKAGYAGNMCVCGSLIDMYAKNGDLNGACLVFSGIKNPDLKCWNSMIDGHGNHGNAEQAFKLFSLMSRQGLEADNVTYISLLSACSHCGLVERGRFYWFCMLNDDLTPALKHYTCMVSLLSRAGFLDEAEEMIVSSSFAANSLELWRILLSACTIFRDLEMGVYAAEQVFRLESEDSSTYLLLSNLYASLGRWDAVAEMRKKIRTLVLEKDPGLSWIWIKRTFHVFRADDDAHPQLGDCRDELFRLQGNMKRRDILENALTF